MTSRAADRPAPRTGRGWRLLGGAGWLLILAPAVLSQDVPPLTGRVVDRAEVLSPSTEAAVAARLAGHEDSTGNQVAVLTVPSLEGAVLEPYATRVFRAWGLGEADRDNGVLLLVARDDREVRIEVGYGLEGALTDATADAIVRHEIVPRFREGDFNGGTLAATDAILAAVAGEYEARGSSGVTLNGRPAGEASLWERLLFGVFFGGVPLVAVASIVALSGAPGPKGDVGSGCAGLFLAPFVGGAVAIVALTGWGFLVVAVAAPLTLIALNRWVEAHPRWGPARRHRRRKASAFAAARERGDETVVVDGRSYSVPVAPSGGGSSGGGFSGGGGSSGGGGASGSW